MDKKFKILIIIFLVLLFIVFSLLLYLSMISREKKGKLDESNVIDQQLNNIATSGMSGNIGGIESIDVSEKIKISDYYFKDEDTVYFSYRENQIIPVEEADVNTFEVISIGFGKDKNNIYFKDSVLYVSNPDEFEFIGEGVFYKDKENVYSLYPRTARDKIKKIEGADVNTFEVISLTLQKDKNHVYVTAVVLEGADPETFKKVNNMVSIDKNRVYFIGVTIDGEGLGGFTFRRRNWQQDIIIEGADPNTFEELGDPWYRDKNYIYFLGDRGYNMATAKVFKNIDVNTFEIIEGSYVRDKNYIYFKDEILYSLDLETFRKKGDWIWDKDNVYFGSHKMDDIDAGTFEVIDEGVFFVKDKNNVYSEYFPIESGIDVRDFNSQTFKSFGGGYYGDKNKIVSVFFWGGATSIVFVPTDASTFQFAGGNYAKDKDNVFYRNTIIKEADIKTFHGLSAVFGKDKDNIFYENYIVNDADPESFEITVDNEEYNAIDKNNFYDCSTGVVCGPGCVITNLKTKERAIYNFFDEDDIDPICNS